MEKVIKIEGGHDLNGTVRISGSKNATVALIPACVLGNEPVTIYGVPNISDVQSLIVLLNELGVYVEKRDEETLYIDPTHMENIPMVSKAVSKSQPPCTLFRTVSEVTPLLANRSWYSL